MNAKAEPKLYFMALLPDPTVQAEVTAFKQTARERFGSGHALKSSPHITLIPPFRSERTDFAALQTFVQTQTAFSLQLQNFDRFGNRVIFVDVKLEPSLSTCQAELTSFCREQFDIQPDPRPFHPHMTVAFRDLPQSIFAEAWAYFSAQPYEREFTANAVTLLKHTGQYWIIEQTFPFNG